MNDPVRRREFVAVCASACAGLLAGCVAMVTHPVPMQGGRARIALADFPELRAPNGAIKVRPEGHADPVIVLADTEGAYTAVSPICTHRGCTVDVSGARLVCPCHGSTYDRTGKVLRGPAQRALTRYAVTREGDALVLDLGTVLPS
jgi:Rieske Fe-S protein